MVSTTIHQEIHNGDIFMALTGENKEEIALASLYVGKEEIAVGGDLCHFTPFKMDASYLVYFINSPFRYLPHRPD